MKVADHRPFGGISYSSCAMQDERMTECLLTMNEERTTKIPNDFACRLYASCYMCPFVFIQRNGRSVSTLSLIGVDISPTMYRIESVAIMRCHVGSVMEPGANSRARQSQSQSHVRPSHAPTTRLQSIFRQTFITYDCSLNVSRLHTFL